MGAWYDAANNHAFFAEADSNEVNAGSIHWATKKKSSYLRPVTNPAPFPVGPTGGLRESSPGDIQFLQGAEGS